MATFSTRMGLTKPLGTEPRSVVPLNANVDLLDAFMPCILVNDGVTPPTAALYDGALVRERTSGIVWEARKNGGGTFDKVYVVYPCSFFAYTPLASLAITGTTLVDYGYTTFVSGKNTTSAQLVANNFVVPVKGIWRLFARQRWATNGTGHRSAVLNIAGVQENDNTENIVAGAVVAGGQVAVECEHTRVLDVGTVVKSQVWQNSGGALNVYNMFQAVMIDPVQ